MKTYWQTDIERGLELLAGQVEARKAISAHDPVADGIEYARREIARRVEELTAPGRFLSPAEWGASQPKRVDEQTVRRYIQRGELEFTNGARGYLIPAGAVRRQLRKVG